MPLDAKIPGGPLAEKWDRHLFELKLVNPANKRKFEPVNLDDLKALYPKLKVVHLTVDTCHDSPENWYIIGMEKR